MYAEHVSHLPISAILGRIRNNLAERDELVLQAPPGAGKTTVVPLSLLEQSWLGSRKILVLEPRRVAARAAAARMAQLLGEEVGETVGYRIRLDTCVSARTRIEVVTEGILARLLQADPGLESVGLVIFDEFHERNLDSDLCLALVLQGRQMFREGPPLKLLVMSATLDGQAVAALLGDAPVLTSEGREYPVETVYGPPYQLRDPIVPRVVSAVADALREQQGSILVFLPGQREISQVARELGALVSRNGLGDVDIAPLYGGLSMQRQQAAIAPSPAGRRKVVLSTNLAETSLTIEGVSVVVDSGLVREGIFDTASGMTRLTTRRVSRASADQRRGRAGRTGPGVCYRLWSEQQHERLVAHSTPEILQADLAPMALQLLSWGVHEVAELAWLNLPSPAVYRQAIDVLQMCEAVFVNAAGRHQLTPQGVRLAQLPLHPRLGHMLLVGRDIRATELACLLAAVLSERNPLQERGVNLKDTIAVLMGEQHCPAEAEGWFRRIWQQARRYGKLAAATGPLQDVALAVPEEDLLGVLLASAYPDRIARRRPAASGHYQLANGRAALLPAEDGLAAQEWLAIADIGGRQGDSSDRIYSAAAISPERFSDILCGLVREEDQVHWDYRYERFVAERRRMLGQLQLDAEPLVDVSAEARGRALLGVVRKKGLSLLPWTRELQQWRQRIELLRQTQAGTQGDTWPDLSDEHLLETLEHWLLPYLGNIERLQDFRALDLPAILRALLPWPLPLELERLAPERWAAPSGSSIRIDYGQSPPVLAVKLQEMFGCDETPTIADGKVALLVHLLSPAGRPLQITQDLAGFWRGGYEAIKREMKGRYPKHPWPDDPLRAVATRHTRQRAESS